MSLFRFSVRFVLLLAVLAGCDPDDDTPRPDGGPQTSSSDAATPATDVARCVELATSFRDVCADQNGETDVRTCLWDGYVALCETGNTALLIAAMECLDASTCRSMSDANERTVCLQELHARDQPPALRDVIEGRCAACGGTECSTLAASAEIFPYLTASAAATFATCAAEACSMDGIITACADEIPALAPFACGG